ncbi:putative beta-1,3-galactosyltransferase 14 [Camellia lanceoleosa]|uniref:Beta-1,3-galactosyltransferase 14 n=1 Tax=Camellia lanceoleosa TaxID=1840588 RepID=A0ACC0IJZ0_9ERIC|nr:putative beta-1,3-galactosyltransferase 14 [Camellia lanceoleosa]
MFSNEDVTIGAWMLAMNVNREDNRQLCEPECTPSSIAVWDIPKSSSCNEDVTIGAWMLAMNVNHEDNRQLCEPECTPSSIAVWDIPKCSGM